MRRRQIVEIARTKKIRVGNGGNFYVESSQITPAGSKDNLFWIELIESCYNA